MTPDLVNNTTCEPSSAPDWHSCPLPQLWAAVADSARGTLRERRVAVRVRATAANQSPKVPSGPG